MSASLDTIVTNIQNLTNAINTASTNFANINGRQDFWGITSLTSIRTGAGRICNIVVIVAGSAPGTVFDAAFINDGNRQLFVIPNTTGIYTLNMPVQYGIVINPGTGMTVAGSFS